MRATEAAFFSPTGTPGHTWSRSLLYGMRDDMPYLPTLDDTLDPTRGQDALSLLLTVFARAAR